MSEIRVNRIVNAAGSGAPQFPSGFSLATGMGITNSPNITGSAAGTVRVVAMQDYDVAIRHPESVCKLS